jgi:hypothetical protein
MSESDLAWKDTLVLGLADNGGPTKTIALLPGSPAIDAGGKERVPTGVRTEQRELLRVR